MIYSDFPIKEITLTDPWYPKVLKKIPNPPQKLYIRGNFSQKILEKTLAVVGSRRITQYGKQVLDLLIPPLVAEKITIISGFMYGVDSLAHQKCLEYGGRTIAVFGCGLDIVYPPENEKLYNEILKTGGAVISEYSPQSKPHLWTYPQRNRIMAGLASLGVLVIEASRESGSLITANFAKRFGKKIFSIPGPITSSSSSGTNFLIKEKQAEMILGPEDILGKKEENINQKNYPTLEPIEEKIFQALAAEPLTADEIAKIINKPIWETGNILTLMSLKNIIFEISGRYFIKE